MGHVLRYVGAVVLAANQMGNALTGGNSHQTVSARAAFARAHGSATGRTVCAVLNALDPHKRPGEDHCAKALRHYWERLGRDGQQKD